MPDSVKDQMKKDLSCSHVLDCIYDLKVIDKKCYKYLNSEDNSVDVQELSEQFERDQSTIHRSLDRLMNCNMVNRTKQTYDSGGYQFVYESRDPEKITNDMDELVENWYEKVQGLISEFENEFQ